MDKSVWYWPSHECLVTAPTESDGREFPGFGVFLRRK